MVARSVEPARQRQLVSLTVAAERYDVSTRTLRRHIAEGLVTGYRVGPRLLKVDLTEADAVYLRRVPAAATVA